MMTDAKEGQPLLKKGYLFVVGGAVVLCLLTGGGKEGAQWVVKKILPGVEFKPKSVSPGKNVSSNSVNMTSEETRDLDLAKDIRSFHDWLNGKQPVVIIIDPGGDDDDDDDDDDRPSVVWEPIVTMTGPGEDGARVAYLTRPGHPMSGKMVGPGDEIPATEDSCGYRVLDVLHQCVWLQAFFLGRPDAELESGDWPEIEAIEHELDRPGVPHRVRFAKSGRNTSGKKIARGETLVFGDSCARLVIEQLWLRGVHFAYRPRSGEGNIDLVCVLVK